NKLSYEKLVTSWLKKHRKTEDHIQKDLKSAVWKIELACELRKKTSATNPWIANRLNMGDPSHVSRHVNTMSNIKD
ncbi:hypothetical protein N9C83_03590, partial [Opitutales bacterium]|nr:hypothetical protein [Opitutales bacterium]